VDRKREPLSIVEREEKKKGVDWNIPGTRLFNHKMKLSSKVPENMCKIALGDGK